MIARRTLISFIVGVLVAVTCRAADAGMIRDEEIERTLRAIAEPIFVAAGLDPDIVEVYLVADPRLNAFVAGGQNIFINTGLLSRSESLDQVAGVIAHETGHIAGGHLTRLGQAGERAATEALIGAVLGAAAAVAGAPQLGTAILAGGATVAQRGLLAFSRGQEQAADQAAIGFLEQAGRSPEGLREFFGILESQNLRINIDGNEFLRTHPLTRARIVFLDEQVAHSPFSGNEPSGEERELHRRMTAKLDGFLTDKALVMRRWSGDGFADRYARAIAQYRAADIDTALGMVEELSAELPGDPWLAELEGQILFESGRIEESVAPYRLALAGAPDSALLRLGLARALLESQGGSEEAKELLEEATDIEPRNPSLWRFLGIARGRDGDEAGASLALAEHAVLVRNREDADLHLARARKRIEPGDPGWLHLQDLEIAAREMEAG